MRFHPFNRDALARIRRGATAADLGWDDTFYTRICRQHGVSPVFTAPVTPVAATQTAPLPIDMLAHHPRRCAFDPATNILTRNQMSVTLTPRIGRLFLALGMSSTLGEHVTRRSLSDKLGIRADNFGGYIQQLREAVGVLHIAVIAKMGCGGGYSLVDSNTGQPLAVSILEGSS